MHEACFSMLKKWQFGVMATIFLFSGMDSSMIILYFYLKTKLEKHNVSVIRIYRWFWSIDGPFLTVLGA